eukprot:g41037.t1
MQGYRNRVGVWVWVAYSSKGHCGLDGPNDLIPHNWDSMILLTEENIERRFGTDKQIQVRVDSQLTIMKTQLLFCTVILLVPFFRSGDCRALDSSTPTRNRPDPQAPLQQSLGPFWIRNGEEYLMLPRKDSKDSSGVSPTRWQMVLSEAPFSAQLQHILREPVGDLEQVSS